MCMHRHTLSQSAFYMYTQCSIDPICLLFLEWKKGRRNQTERTFNQFTFAFSGQISLLEYRFCFFFCVCFVILCIAISLLLLAAVHFPLLLYTNTVIQTMDFSFHFIYRIKIAQFIYYDAYVVPCQCSFLLFYCYTFHIWPPSNVFNTGLLFFYSKIRSNSSGKRTKITKNASRSKSIKASCNESTSRITGTININLISFRSIFCLFVRFYFNRIVVSNLRQ